MGPNVGKEWKDLGGPRSADVAQRQHRGRDFDSGRDPDSDYCYYFPDLPSGFLPSPLIIQSFFGESRALISPGLPEVSQVGRTDPAQRLSIGSWGGSAGGEEAHTGSRSSLWMDVPPR